jgi:hypothetical protein
MSAAQSIDFRKIGGLVYTGRDRGERLRTEFKLDELDRAAGLVEVSIPDEAYTISSSFFLGMFGPSVVRAGSKENFYAHYNFKLPQFLQEVIDGYVARALQDRNLFA